jgi:hypothetical protein
MHFVTRLFLCRNCLTHRKTAESIYGNFATHPAEISQFTATLENLLREKWLPQRTFTPPSVAESGALVLQLTRILAEHHRMAGRIRFAAVAQTQVLTPIHVECTLRPCHYYKYHSHPHPHTLACTLPWFTPAPIEHCPQQKHISNAHTIYLISLVRRYPHLPGENGAGTPIHTMCSGHAGGLDR